MNTSTPYGNYYTEFKENRNGAQFLPYMIDDDFRSLAFRIEDSFYELHSCKTLSTTVKSVHSIIHKISECLSTGYTELAISTFADLNAYFDNDLFKQMEIK